jgi:hypothetical protein
MSTFELFEIRACRRMVSSVPDRALRLNKIWAGGEIALFGRAGQSLEHGAEPPTACPGWREAINALTMYYGDRITLN